MNCNEIGEYKAPKSRSNLKKLLLFLSQFMSKLYNKSWNFYTGALSVDEVELSIKKRYFMGSSFLAFKRQS